MNEEERRLRPCVNGCSQHLPHPRNVLPDECPECGEMKVC